MIVAQRKLAAVPRASSAPYLRMLHCNTWYAEITVITGVSLPDASNGIPVFAVFPITPYGKVTARLQITAEIGHCGHAS